MRKSLIAYAFIFALSVSFALPSTSVAASLNTTQIGAILSLLSSFGASSAVIANVQAALTGATPAPSPTQSSPTCVTLIADLSAGMTDTQTGGDVSKLQAFLGITPTTGYFGPQTESTVKQWQSSHGIVSSGTPDTTGYGFVGPQTRVSMGCVTQRGTSGSQSQTPSTGTYGATSSSNNQYVQTPPKSTSSNAPATGQPANPSVQILGTTHTYTNAPYGFSLAYPSNFSQTASHNAVANRLDVSIVAPNLYAWPYVASTFQLGVSTSTMIVANCASMDPAQQLAYYLTSLGVSKTGASIARGEKIIGGQSFKYATESLDAQGTYASYEYDAGVVHGVCYAMMWGVYGPDAATASSTQTTGAVVLPDAAQQIDAAFSRILQSFSFSEPQSAPQTPVVPSSVSSLPQPFVDTFAAYPTSITAGQSATLSWSVWMCHLGDVISIQLTLWAHIRR